MRYSLLIVLVAILFNGCVSNNEQVGLEKVIEFYGGKVSYKVGTGISTETEFDGSYIEIDISESPYINENFDRVSDFAANIAMLFHENLTEKEKADYDYYSIHIDGGRNSYKQDFGKEETDRRLVREKLALKFVEDYKNRKYYQICNAIIITDTVPLNCNDLIQTFSNIDSIAGPYEKQYRVGYRNVMPQELQKNIDVYLYALQHESLFVMLTVAVNSDLNDKALYGFFVNARYRKDKEQAPEENVSTETEQ